MEYKALYYPQNSKRKIIFIPGWQSPTPHYLINRLKKDYELLVLLFPGHSKELSVTAALTIADYTELYHRALADFAFQPAIRLGHSFGGKILAYIPDREATTLLIAPSCFAPLPLERLKTFYQIKRNKLLKRTFTVLNKPLPSKYLGSRDYQNSRGLERETFLNIKDAYPDNEWKGIKRENLAIIGYSDDRQIPFKRLKKGAKKSKLYPPLRLKGDHYTVLENPEPILFIVDRQT